MEAVRYSPTLRRHPRESGDPVLRSLWGLLGPRFRGDDTRLFDSIRTKHALTVGSLARAVPAALPINIHPHRRHGITRLLAVGRELGGLGPPAALEILRLWRHR